MRGCGVDNKNIALKKKQKLIGVAEVTTQPRCVVDSRRTTSHTIERMVKI